jgi:hypothetical protein
MELCSCDRMQACIHSLAGYASLACMQPCSSGRLHTAAAKLQQHAQVGNMLPPSGAHAMPPPHSTMTQHTTAPHITTQQLACTQPTQPARLPNQLCYATCRLCRWRSCCQAAPGAASRHSSGQVPTVLQGTRRHHHLHSGVCLAVPCLLPSLQVHQAGASGTGCGCSKGSMSSRCS